VRTDRQNQTESDSLVVARDGKPCPSCGSRQVNVFYEAKNVPVQSCLLLSDQGEALRFPLSEIALGLCEGCGFIYNLLFNSSFLDYTRDYEEQQSFSARFNTFARELAQRLIDRYDLRNKTIVEIGCGKGDFLLLLCEMGNNRGVGIDPSYVQGRNTDPVAERVTFIADFYSERYAGHHGDLVCCRHTLEHIPDTAEFLGRIRRSIENHPETVVFFEIPDVTRVLREVAFWDIYYEHCSYFTLDSLAGLFRSCGFEILDLYKGFDDQYLMVEARLAKDFPAPQPDLGDKVAEVANDVAYFSARCSAQLEGWKDKMRELKQGGRRVVIWGSGSKCVAFLSTLAVQNEIEYVVDINPHRHNRYLAGSGKKIVPPSFLQTYRPDTVIAMNPIYLNEIRQDLDRMGIDAELLSV
jgi:SAM-dependent methyltransferase